MVHFYDAFPDLSEDDRLYEFFSGSQVEKVSASKSKMLVFIYLQCDQHISYRSVKKMEQKLYKQVFRRLGFRPKLELKYPFASGYDLEKLMGMCGDSMREELREINTIDYMKFCDEPFEIEENKLILTCDDDFLCHERAKEIRDFFVVRLKRRFDRDVDVTFHYVKKPDEPEIIRVVRTAEEESVDETAAPEKASSSSAKSSGTFIPKKNYRKAEKRDPAVFYGKNVEGEVTPIKEIIDEIGEVVVEGMIRKVDDPREIKGGKLIVTFAITDFTDTIVTKVFIKKELAEEISFFECVKAGNFIRVKGVASFDTPNTS